MAIYSNTTGKRNARPKQEKNESKDKFGLESTDLAGKINLHKDIELSRVFDVHREGSVLINRKTAVF